MELACSDLWVEGPKWLGNMEETEEEVQDAPMPENCAAELRAADKSVTVGLLTTNVLPDIDCNRYSSLEKLLRVTARVLMFVERLKNKVKNRSDSGDGTATASEAEQLAQAEMSWIKAVQQQFIPNNSIQKQFDLFLDGDGIWRCGGRLSNADVPFETKHPILLPRDHYFTSLVVRRAHQRVLHNGVKDTLTEVRARYWIRKGRAFMKKIVRQCVICKKLEGRPCLGPSAPPLPSFRLREDPTPEWILRDLYISNSLMAQKATRFGSACTLVV